MKRTCRCKPNHQNCLTAKEWVKSMVGVWRFNYEKRDVRDRKVHPATFPIALARKAIELFTHKGQLVLDPFAGSGTTLVAAQDTGRMSVGIDLRPKYVKLMKKRLGRKSDQIAVCADAGEVESLLPAGSVNLIVTSPPYSTLLVNEHTNKSRHTDKRRNAQLGKREQYMRDSRDLGTMEPEDYAIRLSIIAQKLRKVAASGSHFLLNCGNDPWMGGRRWPIHTMIMREFEKRRKDEGSGWGWKNTIIWDRTNIVNRIGIFGWPSNYITLGVTYEYLLHFVAV